MPTSAPTITKNQRTASFIAALAIGASLLLSSGGTIAKDTETCHVGAYALPDNVIVDVGLSDGGLRWRRLDGETGKLVLKDGVWTSTAGWTGKPDDHRVAFGQCGEGSIRFDGIRGEQVALTSLETTFTSRAERLAGRLILPPGEDPVPIVVLLQGSERLSARDFDPLQRLLPAAGVGAFVYDKRGTGTSEGEYTQDFSLLADDAVAAVAAARELAGARVGRIGFQGPSQGGWVAPIAASRTSVDFVIVSFGLAVSVLEEDLEAVVFQMEAKGHEKDAIDRALELARAAGRVFESGFAAGIPELEALRQRYRNEPWYADVQGNFTGVILGLSGEQLRGSGAEFRWGTPFRYDPRPTLARLDVPQLWILGGQDRDAPIAETVRRLEQLRSDGRPITIAIYPTAEHGMTEFEIAADGARQSTRYADGYFRMMRDFARDGWICPPYGDARVSAPRNRPCPPSKPTDAGE